MTKTFQAKRRKRFLIPSKRSELIFPGRSLFVDRRVPLIITTSIRTEDLYVYRTERSDDVVCVTRHHKMPERFYVGA